MKVRELILELDEKDPEAEVYMLIDHEGILWDLHGCRSGKISAVAYGGNITEIDHSQDQFYSDTDASGWERLPASHGYPPEPRIIGKGVILFPDAGE